jgi:hypothetical protein
MENSILLQSGANLLSIYFILFSALLMNRNILDRDVISAENAISSMTVFGVLLRSYIQGFNTTLAQDWRRFESLRESEPILASALRYRGGFDIVFYFISFCLSHFLSYFAFNVILLTA